MSANRKKKYNPERGEYRRRSMLYRFRDAKLSSLVKGVTVAHNGTWVTKDEHDPLQDKMEYQITGLEPLRDHLHNMKSNDCAFRTLIKRVEHWRFYITIYNTDSFGVDYDIKLTVIDRKDKFTAICWDILNNVIPKALEKRNKNDVIEWGFFGEVL